jgi:CCR4-NOT transcriptional regulation complex NOT5 subunit
LLPLPLVSSSFESAHHFCIQMKRLTAPCLCTVNHCCRAAKQKQYLVAAPAPVKAVKPSPLISSSSLLLMTARRLRAVVLFFILYLLQGSNAEAASTLSPLLHQHAPLQRRS